MRPLSPILNTLLEDLKTGIKKERSALQQLWPQIVGDSFAGRTKPSLLQGGTLCIWVEDSVLAFELSQRYGVVFLRRAQGLLGEETVRKIKFRVGQIR